VCHITHSWWIYPHHSGYIHLPILCMCGYIHTWVDISTSPYMGGYIHLPILYWVDISIHGWIYPLTSAYMGGYIHLPIYSWVDISTGLCGYIHTIFSNIYYRLLSLTQLKKDIQISFLGQDEIFGTTYYLTISTWFTKKTDQRYTNSLFLAEIGCL
jgi:hypothetical protein